MSASDRRIGPVFAMQVIVSVYLVTLGVVAISAYNQPGSAFARDMSRFFGTSSSGSFDLAVAIAEVVAGVIIFLGLFPVVSNQLIYFAAIIIALLWVVRIVYYFFFQHIFQPDFISWLNRLSLDLIIATGMWLVASRYR